MIEGYTSNNAIVDKMYGIDITGNITPPAWYQTITHENGKPNNTAIVLLSDIVYWYRPQEVRDERTGDFIGTRKKFKADLLQRSYTQLAEQFGFSKRQVADAVKELEKLGVIRRVFRNIYAIGRTMNNVLFIELIPERLKEITYLNKSDKTMSHYNVTPYTKESRSLSQSKETDSTVKEDTNTKITTEITTKDYHIISIPEVETDFKEQIGYDAIVSDLPFKKGQLDEIVSIAVDVLTSNKATTRVNKEERPTERVKEKLKMLDIGHIKYVLDSLGNSISEIKNIRAVIITSLYNAASTIDNYYTAKVNHDLAKEKRR